MIDTPVPADTDEVAQLIADAGVFTDADVECVRELLHDHFSRADHNGYEFFIFRQDGRILGMICYGPTPLTVGTYDLYWLVTSPLARRQGVARQLEAAAVEAIRKDKGARLLVLETSSTDGYAPARAFYANSGYTRQATVPDFYAEGDDLVIFTKRLR